MCLCICVCRCVLKSVFLSVCLSVCLSACLCVDVGITSYLKSVSIPIQKNQLGNLPRCYSLPKSILKNAFITLCTLNLKCSDLFELNTLIQSIEGDAPEHTTQLLCCHVTVTGCSVHQKEQNCEISRVDRHAMMTLWQVYTNTRLHHVTACWNLMYQLVFKKKPRLVLVTPPRHVVGDPLLQLILNPPLQRME